MRVRLFVRDRGSVSRYNNHKRRRFIHGSSRNVNRAGGGAGPGGAGVFLHCSRPVPRISADPHRDPENSTED